MPSILSVILDIQSKNSEQIHVIYIILIHFLSPKFTGLGRCSVCWRRVDLIVDFGGVQRKNELLTPICCFYLFEGIHHDRQEKS